MNTLQSKQATVDIARRKPAYHQDSFGFETASIMSTEDNAVHQVFSYYTQTLASHHKAQEFLKARGIGFDGDPLNEFKIGFADRTLGLCLSKLSKDEEQSTRGALQRAGLIKPTGHEFLRGSLVFPFIDFDNRIVGAYGRRVTPKLRSQSVYHVHWLTNETSFFNLKALTDYSTVIICKNPLDALTLHTYGYPNVVATMGAKSYSKHHTSVLKSMGINKAIIAFGTSKEALVFSQKAIALNHKVGIQSELILLPNGLDPSNYAMSVDNPRKGFEQALKRSLSLSSSTGYLKVS
ncbi:MAG: toprim domain-containing protein [Kangiellaceae bacterium]|nr:toprim domain-containing protein [Kangiellaceae bacterium]MCW9000796.1 toprim domain-containing protein [Kangiellaceae bacterium]